MNISPVSISPYSTDHTDPLPHDFKTKVKLFWERFHGWKFDIAKKMLDGYTSDVEIRHPSIPHSGYAAMDVMFSYFEPLGKHLHGYLDPVGRNGRPQTESGKYFKEGVKDIFNFKTIDLKETDMLLDLLWVGIRCGLYHTGQTKGGVFISGNPKETFQLATEDKVIIVNPHNLVDVLIEHVSSYRDRLLNEGENSKLGKNFIARYDHDNPSVKESDLND